VFLFLFVVFIHFGSGLITSTGNPSYQTGVKSKKRGLQFNSIPKF